ncbi:MAG: oxidoreductase [Acidobacteria bacterium]|nr:MAG: oxidoreductase [Acidobacteriota bacterium]
MRKVRSRTGAEMPVLGQGTWEMGEDPRRRREEIEALRLGLDLGMSLIDTAEMYADGGAERIVGEAVRGRRHEVFLVSKVLPENASLEGTIRAAERSLKRLRTDSLDLYLLHWESSHPLEETLAGFERLIADGKIRHYGVSNIDLQGLQRAETLPGGGRIACDQVYYNLSRRGIERKLLPWCAKRGIIVMAYSPLDQGKLCCAAELWKVARRHGVTPACVAIAWTLRRSNVISIPKASSLQHVRENASAPDLRLTEQDLADLHAAFPPPSRDIPLETL